MELPKYVPPEPTVESPAEAEPTVKANGATLRAA
jgi:hypothetical protein